jgi:hypothetical protein
MFVVRTVENLANSVGKLVCSEKSVGFDHLALAVNPLRFDGVQPRALLRKQATDDPYPLTALFDSAVVGTEPTPHLFGDVPTGVVPDENENLLAKGFELSHAPLEKAPRYRRNRPSVHEPKAPSTVERRVIFYRLEPWQWGSGSFALRVGVGHGDKRSCCWVCTPPRKNRHPFQECKHTSLTFLIVTSTKLTFRFSEF